MNKKFLIGLGAAVIVAVAIWLVMNGEDNGGVLPIQRPNGVAENSETATSTDAAAGDQGADSTTPALSEGNGSADIDADLQALDKEDLAGEDEFGSFDGDANQL